MVPLRGFIRQQVWKQILALNSRGGVYPRPLLFKCIISKGVVEHCKISNSKHQITNKYQIPILKLPAASSRESSKCKVFILFYCSSLANPAASYGECARWSIFNDQNKKRVWNFETGAPPAGWGVQAKRGQFWSL